MAAAPVPVLAVGPEPSRTAVVVLGATPAESTLAEGLTELLIATVAVQVPAVLIGTGEFLKGLETTPTAAKNCLEQAPCRNKAAASLGLGRILLVTVAAHSGGYLVSESLFVPPGDLPRKHVARTVIGGVDRLMADLRAATIEVFSQPRPATLQIHAGVPTVSILVNGEVKRPERDALDLPSGRHVIKVTADGHLPWTTTLDASPGQRIDLNVTADQMPERLRWPTRVAIAGGVGALAAAGLGYFWGLEASGNAVGTTRRDVQSDFDRRRTLGVSSDVALVTAGVLTAAVAYTLFRYRNHVFTAD